MTMDMDEIYKKLAPEKIPWNIEEPPKILVDLVDSGKISPCKTIDLGCGAGNYAIHLASKGFNVTGIDISPTAIMIAQKNSQKKNVKCCFIAADISEELTENIGTFDFAYDWEVLHHIYPEQREKYARNVYKLLNPNGFYMSVCFSEKNTNFKGTGKYRETPLGTRLYFSSEDEIRDVFEKRFNIMDLSTLQIQGKYGPHLVVHAFMQKK
ncbi:class I SAM-dependent methyltransferase [Elusimicrobiota bacterium]